MRRGLCIYNHTPGTWRGRGAYRDADSLAGFHQNTPAEYQRYDDDRKHYHKIARLQK